MSRARAGSSQVTLLRRLCHISNGKSGLVTYVYTPTLSDTKGTRLQGTWLATLDSNEGGGMTSQVLTTLVSRTGKATFLVPASASSGAWHTGHNKYSPNIWRNVLKVTDLTSLKNTGKSTFLGDISLRAQVALGKPMCLGWAQDPIKTRLCNPVF